MVHELLVVSDPGVCAGKPVVRGTRVPVEYVLELWDRGYGADYIHEQYPSVPKELVERVVELVRKGRLIRIAR